MNKSINEAMNQLGIAISSTKTGKIMYLPLLGSYRLRIVFLEDSFGLSTKRKLYSRSLFKKEEHLFGLKSLMTGINFYELQFKVFNCRLYLSYRKQSDVISFKFNRISRDFNNPILRLSLKTGAKRI